MILKGSRQIIVKGMNRYDTLFDRQDAMAALLENELDEYVSKGYNPITCSYMREESTVPEYIISPDLPFIEALYLVKEKKCCSQECKIDLKSVIKGTELAAMRLHMTSIAVKDIKRRHILILLEQVREIKGSKWSDNQFNYYRAHLMMLFEELLKWEAIEVNPVAKIQKKSIVKVMRKVYTSEEHERIDKYLEAQHRQLWIFSRIFYYAGCRRTELLRVKYQDVDLNAQTFKTTRLKGQNKAEVLYTITDEAMPFWNMVIDRQGIDPGPYLFSKGLLPGNKALTSHHLSHLWLELVKQKLNIDADFYSLKHKRSTKISATAGVRIAAIANNESEHMIKEHYDVNGREREHQLIKGLIVGL
jgi:integrase